MDEKAYLGDSVFATFHEDHMLLTTEIAGDVDQKIRLSGFTMRALMQFMSDLGLINL